MSHRKPGAQDFQARREVARFCKRKGVAPAAIDSILSLLSDGGVPICEGDLILSVTKKTGPIPKFPDR